MQKLYILFSLLLTYFSVGSTIHNISIENMAFSPAAISSVMVGDTIRWTLVNGSNHTTTSNSLPTNAAAWDHAFTTIGETFDYKVTVAGTYGYLCTNHTSMVAGFIANPPVLSIPKISKNNSDIKAYPNPFKSKIAIPVKNAETIEIFSVLGEKVKTIDISSFEKTVTIDLSDLKKGVYFYALKDNTGTIETRKIVKSE